jgi:hypothetical protein
MLLLSQETASSQTFPDLGIPNRVNRRGRWYKKPRKAASGQKEMLMPIEGRKPKGNSSQEDGG